MKDLLKDWKLKLKYGKSKTPFKHYTVIAEGVIIKLKEGFTCPTARAFVGMKVWVTSENESAELIQSIGDQIGFSIDGKIQIFVTDPIQPPSDKPFAYDINFTPIQD